MTDIPKDNTVAQTAEENIPTQSNPMDNIHGTVEDISNKASGYKVCLNLSLFSTSNLLQTYHPTLTSLAYKHTRL